MAVGEKTIKPMVSRQKCSSLNIYTTVALIHTTLSDSSFLTLRCDRKTFMEVKYLTHSAHTTSSGNVK
jgi:hypothetical protein